MDWDWFWGFCAGLGVGALVMDESGRRIVHRWSYGGRRGADARAARTTTGGNAPRMEGWEFDAAVARRVQELEVLDSDGDSHFHMLEDPLPLSTSQDEDGTERTVGSNEHSNVEIVRSPASVWDEYRPWESLEGLRAYAAHRYGRDWDKHSGSERG